MGRNDEKRSLEKQRGRPKDNIKTSLNYTRCYTVGWIHQTQGFEQCGICEHSLDQLKEFYSASRTLWEVWTHLHKIRNGAVYKSTRLPTKQMGPDGSVLRFNGASGNKMWTYDPTRIHQPIFYQPINNCREGRNISTETTVATYRQVREEKEQVYNVCPESNETDSRKFV